MQFALVQISIESERKCSGQNLGRRCSMGDTAYIAGIDPIDWDMATSEKSAAVTVSVLQH